MLLITKIHGKLLLQLVPISSCFAAKGPGLNGLGQRKIHSWLGGGGGGEGH